MNEDDRARLRVIDGGRSTPTPMLDDEDGETIEVIAHLMGSGGLSLHEMHVTDAAISQFIRDHGPPASCLGGFAFPAFGWPLEQDDGHAIWLIVIDQGSKRISFRARRRNANLP